MLKKYAIAKLRKITLLGGVAFSIWFENCLNEEAKGYSKALAKTQS